MFGKLFAVHFVAGTTLKSTLSSVPVAKILCTITAGFVVSAIVFVTSTFKVRNNSEVWLFTGGVPVDHDISSDGCSELERAGRIIISELWRFENFSLVKRKRGNNSLCRGFAFVGALHG